MEPMRYGDPKAEKCAVCGRAVHKSENAYCSQKCADEAQLSGDKVQREVGKLMQQYRLKGWGDVD
jgi:predicted nucleic acid-binding Zn ribbon protein